MRECGDKIPRFGGVFLIIASETAINVSIYCGRVTQLLGCHVP